MGEQAIELPNKQQSVFQIWTELGNAQAGNVHCELNGRYRGRGSKVLTTGRGVEVIACLLHSLRYDGNGDPLMESDVRARN